MKSRNGFVSNSSSSSFVITSKKISFEKVEKVMNKVWRKFLKMEYTHQEKDSYEDFQGVLSCDDIMITDWEQIPRKDKKILLIDCFDEMAYWNPYEPLKTNFDFYLKLLNHVKPKFLRSFLAATYRWLCGVIHGTYLSEAMKSKVYMISKDNAVPYEVLKKLKKKFKKNIKIHYHMG
jgi:hypothetical protein